MDPKTQSIPTGSRLAIRWMTLMFYTITLWCCPASITFHFQHLVSDFKIFYRTARMTVAVTIVRLLPRGPSQRVAKGVSILFGLMALGICLQKVAACTPQQARISRCTSIKNYKVYTAILELVSECKKLSYPSWRQRN